VKFADRLRITVTVTAGHAASLTRSATDPWHPSPRKDSNKQWQQTVAELQVTSHGRRWARSLSPGQAVAAAAPAAGAPTRVAGGLPVSHSLSDRHARQYHGPELASNQRYIHVTHPKRLCRLPGPVGRAEDSEIWARAGHSERTKLDMFGLIAAHSEQVGTLPLIPHVQF
jgi:hypothetical protein